MESATDDIFGGPNHLDGRSLQLTVNLSGVSSCALTIGCGI